MRNFTHQLIIKLRKFKVSDYIEVGFSLNETRW